ncbi:hypothetical protein L6164_009420 [Bauhinia variegata]|uniref:Uncharacterized protein n=1 Tax=Bauhinia variegata TaxID=167791 RepID=A0ACB9PJM0_BAUVA|nr:hypothetical protein L6164_009420 [Bauhinia variegata]
MTHSVRPPRPHDPLTRWRLAFRFKCRVPALFRCLRDTYSTQSPLCSAHTTTEREREKHGDHCTGTVIKEIWYGNPEDCQQFLKICARTIVLWSLWKQSQW